MDIFQEIWTLFYRKLLFTWEKFGPLGSRKIQVLLYIKLPGVKIAPKIKNWRGEGKKRREDRQKRRRWRQEEAEERRQAEEEERRWEEEERRQAEEEEEVVRSIFDYSLPSESCSTMTYVIWTSKEVPRVLPNSLPGWGVCYQVYVIGPHERTHVDHRNMPNHCTSIYHEWMCVCVWQQWGRLLLGILHKMWCGPVCSPGSWSGRGWHPLILVWHRVVVGLSCSYCKVQSHRTYVFLLVHYINLY